MKLRRLNFGTIIFILFLVTSVLCQSSFEDDPFTTSFAPKPDLQILCVNFLECESEMMNIHQKCTEKSRKATGEACGLMDDFVELNRLMEARVNEFGDCVGNETEKIENDSEQIELLELPFKNCEKVNVQEMEEVMINDGCWKAVAMVKQRCQKLQKCCPAAKACMKSGRNSEATKEVRQKHIEINRKTLECRESMKKVLDEQKKGNNNINSLMAAKAHAVLTAQGDTIMDAIHKKYVFTKKERHQLRSIRKGLNIDSTNLTVTLAPSFPTLLMQQQQQPNEKMPNHQESEIVRKLVYKNNRKPPKMRKIGQIKNNDTMIVFGSPSIVQPKNTEIRPPTQMPQNIVKMKSFSMEKKKNVSPKQSPRLQQLEEFETILKSMEVEESTKQARKSISTRKPELRRFDNRKRKFHNQRNKNFPMGGIPHNQKGIIPRFHAVKQHQSFALPSSVNLTRMHVLDARPKLMKKQRQHKRKPMSFRNLNIFGRPTTTTTTTTTKAANIKKTSFAGELKQNRPRIQSIQTQTNFEKPIMKSFKIEQQDLIPLNNNNNNKNKDINNINLSPEAFVSSDGTWTLEPHGPATTTTTTTPAPTTTMTTQKTSSTAAVLNNFHDYEEFIDGGETHGFKLESPAKKNVNNRRLLGDRQKVVEVAMRSKNMDSQELLPFDVNPSLMHSLIDGTTNENTTPLKSAEVSSDSNILEDMLRTTIKSPEPNEKIFKPKSLNRVVAAPPKIETISKADESELLLVKDELIKNLEQFMQNNERKQNDKIKFIKETNRLELLRTNRKQYEIDNSPQMNYCHLYTICSDELKLVTKTCEVTNGRLIPGLPRRRFGECNRKLVNQYKKMNSIKQKVEKLFDNCLAEKIELGTASPINTCPKDWPLLPEFEVEITCVHRVRMVQNHCAKLGRCCSAAQECRLKIDEMPISNKLIAKEEAVAQASAKCQIKAYNDYLKFKTKKFGDIKMDQQKQLKGYESGYDSLAAKNNPTTKSAETWLATTTTTSSLPNTISSSTKKSIIVLHDGNNYVPERTYPTLIHMGEYQPQSKSIQIDDKKLSNLKRIDTNHIKLLWQK